MLRAATRRHRTRPVLLFLVYGVFLVLIGVTASAQAILVSEHFTAGMLNSVVGNDSATVRTFVNGNLTKSDLTGSASAARVAAVNQQLAALVTRGGILRTEIRTPDGVVLFSDVASLTGQQAPRTAAFAETVGGQPSAGLDDPQAPEVTGTPLDEPSLIREYLPVIANGKVQAVFAMWRDAQPILDALGETRRDILIVTLMAAAI